LQMPKQGQPITVNATNLASLGKADVIRILYVDDDLNAMEISKQILMELADFEIDNASCVDEAFKKLETCNYDVVISDYQMPQKDGLQFLKELREKKNDIPFILFTGKGREEVAIKAINLGAQGYFNKQGDPETVYGELANGINLAVKAGNSKSALIYDENSKPTAILSIVRDITKQKEAEKRLLESEEKYRAFLNSANVLIQSIDSKGHFIFVNPEWKRVLSYTNQELGELNVAKIIRPDYVDKFFGILKHVVGGECFRDVETVFIANDGKEVIVNGNICPIFKDGKFSSSVGFFEDITLRKESEAIIAENNRKLNLMNEKLRVVGSLTRHDVRNKLSVVMGQAYLLKKKHSSVPEIVDRLALIEKAAADSVKIFEFSRMYEQIGLEELAFVDVGEKFEEASALFSGKLPVLLNECSGLCVLADSFFRQLFYNFIDNSMKHGQKTSEIRLHFKLDKLDRLQLIYEDNGVGIPPENKQLIFKEGFSTGGSTGFGLFLI
jgi:PAS domain S-box-containing protein